MSWTVRLAAGLAIGGVLVGLGAPAVAVAEPRQMLGTISVQGDVRIRDAGSPAGEPVAHSGAALLESAVVITGEKGAALLNLTSDGMIGLRAGGALEIGKRGTDGLRLMLEVGEILVRLPARSRVTLVTASAVIRPDALMPASAGPVAAAEARVRLLPDGNTIVRVETGSLRIEGAVGGPTVVRAGEEATLALDASPRVAAASTAPPTTKMAAPAVEPKKPAGGIFASDGDLALLLGVGGAVVVGGTLGGLAAAGEFSGSTDAHGGAGTAVSGAQASAFRTPR